MLFRSKNGVVYEIKIDPSAKLFKYEGSMKKGFSWIVNFTKEDMDNFKKQLPGIQGLYDPDNSNYLIVLDKNIIESFEEIK